jgi:hypothetical protein
MNSKQQWWMVACFALATVGANLVWAEESAEKTAPAGHPAAGQPWTNSLGAEFLPIPGLSVLFGKYEVTLGEYRKFVPGHKNAWSGVHFSVTVHGPAGMREGVGWWAKWARRVWWR